MKNVYAAFETEKNLEKTGIEINYGSFSFTIARAGGANQKYNKALEIATKPFRRAIETEAMDDERSREILMEVYSKVVVLGWKGVTDKEGKKQNFTSENCLKLFKDLPDLFEDIKHQANQSALFRKSIQEAEAKN
jgi:hypothetical protein